MSESGPKLRQGMFGFLKPRDAELVLKPYAQRLVDILGDCWSDYRTAVAPQLLGGANVQGKRTRADFVQARFQTLVAERIGDEPGIELVDDKYGGRFIVIDSAVGVRLKKIDSRGRSKNIQTGRQRLMRSHELEVPELPTTQILIIGYELDRLELEIARVAVVSPNGYEVEWQFDLRLPENREENLPSIVERSAADEEIEETTSVRVKASAKSKRKSSSKKA